MHTEASDRRKGFLAARATLIAEWAEVTGDGIAETKAADESDGTTGWESRKRFKPKFCVSNEQLESRERSELGLGGVSYP